jgi:hypothetical protein
MRSRTAGVMTTLMRSDRDRRLGKPVKGHAILERMLLVGTRLADHIRASGHSGCIATGQASTRKTGRIHGCTRTLRRKPDSSCTAGAVHTWPFASFRTHALNDRSWRNNGHRAAQARNSSVAFDPTRTWGRNMISSRISGAGRRWPAPSKNGPTVE